MDLTYTNVKITFGDNKSGENKELDNVFVMSYSQYLYSIVITFQVQITFHLRGNLNVAAGGFTIIITLPIHCA